MSPVSRERMIAICRVALFALFALVVCQRAAFCQGEQLQARIGANVVTYPVQQMGSEHYISILDARELLLAIDAASTVRWDASTGVFSAKLRGRPITFYRDQNVVRVGDAIIDSAKPLLATRGRFFVPLSSLERVVRTLPDVQTNLSQFVSAETPGPAPAPAPTLSTDLPSLPGSSMAGGASTPARAVDPQLAQTLLARAVVVIDPQGSEPPVATATTTGTAATTGTAVTTGTAANSDGLPGIGGEEETGESTSSTQPAAEITVRVAERCREILQANPSVLVSLTIQSKGVSTLTPEQRVQVINRARGRALISLRLDSSPFADNSGYRVYTTNAKVDPENGGGKSKGPQAAYLPYQNLSATLASILDGELSRGGLAAAPDRVKVAPLYLLRRVSAPSACVTLAYSSSERDRARLGDPAFVESAARSLAQALLEFERYLQQSAGAN